eukprot:6643935-Lingulodinium_polyedra.AAC.1
MHNVTAKRPRGSQMPQEMKERIMKEHAAIYDALPSGQKRQYEQMAEQANEAAVAERQADTSHLESRAALATHRLQEEKDLKGSTPLMDSHRLGEDDLQELYDMYTSNKYSRAL